MNPYDPYLRVNWCSQFIHCESATKYGDRLSKIDETQIFKKKKYFNCLKYLS
jgi:hypothetical protein